MTKTDEKPLLSATDEFLELYRIFSKEFTKKGTDKNVNISNPFAKKILFTGIQIL